VDAADETEKGRAKEAMVELLNKRSYLRNLVRDVNEALGL
jgi:molecular chaperone HscB